MTSTFGKVRFGPTLNGVAPQSLGKPAAAYPGAVATDSDLTIAVDRQITSLALGLNTADASMTVMTPSIISAYNLLSIDNEIVKTTGPPIGNTVPIQRGFDGTTPTTHLAGASVAGMVDAYHHNRLVAEIEAIQTTLGPNLSNVSGSAIVSTAYNFAPQTPGGSLAPGSNVVTLNPIPKGIAVNSYLYVSGGTGTAEPVLVTGWNPSNGQAIIACANAHTGAWTIQSASAGLQEAIIVAGAATGGQIYVPVGVYTMHGTIRVDFNAIHISGAGGLPNGTTGSVLQRTTDYGHTMTVGSSGGIYDFAIEDVAFRHIINYSAGPPPTMVNQITVNTQSAHINVTGSQGSRIENCSFADMPIGLAFRGCAHFLVKHNFITGLWDPSFSNCQQSIAGIYLTYSGGQVPTNMDIEGNYITGYTSAPRSRTVNGTTFTSIANVGPQYCILAENFEDIHISGGILQGAATANIGFVNTTGNASLGCEVTNLQFDSAGTADVMFVRQAANFNNITISNCTFDGEVTTGLNAIYGVAGSGDVVSGLTITGCSIEAYVGAAILLGDARDVVISGNSIRGYNSMNAFPAPGDALNGAAIGFYGTSNSVAITGNSLGGGVAGDPVGSSGVYTVFGITLQGSIFPNGAAANWAVSGNNVVSLGAINPTDLAYFDAKWPPTFGSSYYIATETGANNAIAGSLCQAIGLFKGLTVSVKLAHTLQAGANTFAYNGGPAVAIKSSRNPTSNIATAYAATGTITLQYDGTEWLDVSQ